MPNRTCAGLLAALWLIAASSFVAAQRPARSLSVPDGSLMLRLPQLWKTAFSEFQQVILSAGGSDTEYARYVLIEEWNANVPNAMVSAAAFTTVDRSAAELSWQAAFLSKNLAAELAFLERRTFSAGGTSRLLDDYRRMRNVLSTSSLLIQAGYSGTPYDQLLPTKRTYDRQVRAALRAARPEDFLVDVRGVQAALRRGDVLLDYVVFKPLDPRSMTLSGAPHYGVFVVTASGGVLHAIDLGAADAIDAAVSRYRLALESDQAQGGNESGLARLSSDVRRLVLAPALDRLDVRPQRLYVAPVSRLSLMPFDVLAETTAPIRYLIESMDIVAIASPRELTRFRPGRQGCNRATGCSATLLGDPQYARRTGAPPAAAQDGGVFASRADVSHVWQPFERIRPTRTLVNALSRDLTTANVAVRAMLDADASEGALYGRDPGQLLLFATHGLFLQGADRLSMTIGLDLDTGAGRRTVQTPLGTSTAQRPREDLFGDYLYEQRDPSVFSMLALAGAADTPLARQGQGLILRPDDGFLTAYEAELLSLERTDVVLLVGCETGLGFVPSRTGQPSFGYSSTNTALGFRRALHIAGAKTVVGSLWPVLDRPATQYAQEFIRRWLIDGQARYGAHRAAQLAVLKEARSTRGNGNPLFWAGFVYEGDPGDLP